MPRSSECSPTRASSTARPWHAISRSHRSWERVDGAREPSVERGAEERDAVGTLLFRLRKITTREPADRINGHGTVLHQRGEALPAERGHAWMRGRRVDGADHDVVDADRRGMVELALVVARGAHQRAVRTD